MRAAATTSATGAPTTGGASARGPTRMSTACAGGTCCARRPTRRRWRAGRSPAAGREVLSDEERALERVMLGLRERGGLALVLADPGRRAGSAARGGPPTRDGLDGTRAADPKGPAVRRRRDPRAVGLSGAGSVLAAGTLPAALAFGLDALALLAAGHRGACRTGLAGAGVPRRARRSSRSCSRSSASSRF